MIPDNGTSVYGGILRNFAPTVSVSACPPRGSGRRRGRREAEVDLPAGPVRYSPRRVSLWLSTICNVPESSSVLVVGAGAAGLAVAAALLRRGVTPVILERHSAVGGLWALDNPGTPTRQDVKVVTSSTQLGYDEAPLITRDPYPRQGEVLAYLRAFARAHLDPSHFRFGAEVRDFVLRDASHWCVTLTSGEILSSRAVVLCTGLYWEPYVPASASEAAGSWVHSRDFAPRSIRSGDRVCVVGAGNSCADVAVSAYRAGAELWLRWRGVPWLVPSFLDGCPTDTLPLDLEGIPTCMWGAATQHQLAVKAMPSTRRVAEIAGEAMPTGLPYESPTITSDRLLALLLDRDRVHLAPLHAPPPPVDLTVYCTGYAKPRGITGLARQGIGLDPTRVISTSLPGLFVVGNVSTEGGGFGIFSRMAQVVSALAVTQIRDSRQYHRTLARLAVWKPNLLWGLRRPSPTSALVYSQALLHALDRVGEL
jgi:hypothetical protein